MRLPFFNPLVEGDLFSILPDGCRLACHYLSVCCGKERTRWSTVALLPSQTINGIGASGAWWTQDIYHYPDHVREKVAELLFSKETGLGLSSYRHNIGGGGVGVGPPAKAPPTPYVSEGVYNFSADPAGNYFLIKAAEYGVEQLTAFVNSAPANLTSNGQSCGGLMLKENVPKFSQYLADVMMYWRTQGVVFTHVSPMNEPDNNFANLDGSPCRQEGMAVMPPIRASLPGVLRLVLDSAGLSSIGILADETSTVPEFLGEIPLWLPQAKAHIAAVAHHDYLFADDRSAALMGVEGRAFSGKDMWFTEICCYKTADDGKAGDPAALLGFGTTYDPTMVGALQLGSLLYKSFVIVGDTHFDWWTAVSYAMGCSPHKNNTCATDVNPHGWNDGLIYYDHNYAKNHNYHIYVSKRFHLLKHFSRFVPLGAVRYEVLGGSADHRVMAFKLPSGAWSVIVMNMALEDNVFELEYLEMGSPRAAWRTSEAEDWERVRIHEAGEADGRFLLPMPRLSITTILFA